MLGNDSRQDKGFFIVRVPEGMGENNENARLIATGRNNSVN